MSATLEGRQAATDATAGRRRLPVAIVLAWAAAVADAVGWLAARPWLVGAAGLGLAGAFQFSSLKDRCLTECRHPAAYLLRHYRRGPRAARAAGVAALALAVLVTGQQLDL
jgi:predicted metal-binding membrane protein